MLMEIHDFDRCRELIVDGHRVRLDSSYYTCTCPIYRRHAVANVTFMCPHIRGVAQQKNLREILAREDETMPNSLEVYFPFTRIYNEPQGRRGVSISVWLRHMPAHTPTTWKVAISTGGPTVPETDLGFLPWRWDPDKRCSWFNRQDVSVLVWPWLVGWGQTLECGTHGLRTGVTGGCRFLGMNIAWASATRGADILNTGACYKDPADLIPDV